MSKLLDQTRALMRLKHYSYKTEKIYIYWMKKFFHFHQLRHPAEMAAAEVEAFLTDLAVKQSVSASTQNQALAAILFLYREVLKINLPWLENFTPAKKSKHLPVVLTKEEVSLILSRISGVNWIIANLLYGSGLRLTEALRLRVKDLDFEYRQITVRGGKGAKDRVTVLPTKLIEPLKKQLTQTKIVHERDIKCGLGRVEMPFAMARKYPNANIEWKWQYVFPSKTLSKNPRTGTIGRHHLSESSLQKPFKQAVNETKIEKPASPHTLQHSFATHLLQNWQDIRTIQDLLGHKELTTTMVYTHVMQSNRLGIKSPADF